jgi:hypothetical protein
MWGDKRSISLSALLIFLKWLTVQGFSRKVYTFSNLPPCNTRHAPQSIIQKLLTNKSNNWLPLTTRDNSIVLSTHASYSNHLYACCILYSMISTIFHPIIRSLPHPYFIQQITHHAQTVDSRPILRPHMRLYARWHSMERRLYELFSLLTFCYDFTTL